MFTTDVCACVICKLKQCPPPVPYVMKIIEAIQAISSVIILKYSLQTFQWMPS